MQKNVTRRGAAEHLTDHGYPTSPRTLAKYATIGGGPPYRLYLNRAIYDTDELIRWADARAGQARTSTAAAV